MLFLGISQSTLEHWTASRVITGNLVASLLGPTVFWTGEHAMLLKKGQEEIQRRNDQNVEHALAEDLGPLQDHEVIQI